MESQKSISKLNSDFKKFFEYDENVVIANKDNKTKEPKSISKVTKSITKKNTKISTVADPLKEDPFFFF